MARVQVADDVWADFRAAAGHRPLSEVLGELVTREVERYRSRRLRDGQLDPREITEALAYAARQQAELAVIVDRLERLRDLGGAEARGGVIEGAPSAAAERWMDDLGNDGTTDAINRAVEDLPEDTAFTDAAASRARPEDRT